RWRHRSEGCESHDGQTEHQGAAEGSDGSEPGWRDHPRGCPTAEDAMHLSKLRSAGGPACVHHTGCAGGPLRAGPLGRYRVVGLARHSQRAGLPGLSHQHVAKRCYAASGPLASACSTNAAAAVLPICYSAKAAQPASATPYGFLGAVTFVTRVTTATFSETPPSTLQLLYFVRAEDANGNLSAPSNLVGGPSLAAQ